MNKIIFNWLKKSVPLSWNYQTMITICRLFFFIFNQLIIITTINNINLPTPAAAALFIDRHFKLYHSCQICWMNKKKLLTEICENYPRIIQNVSTIFLRRSRQISVPGGVDRLIGWKAFVEQAAYTEYK